MTEREILKAILKNDWAGLISYLTIEEIEKYRIETGIGEYEWAGDYAEDARYTYPNRNKLIYAVIKKKLEEGSHEE